MDKLKILIQVLQQLRSEALSINSDETFKVITQKYNMLFLGEKFNTIYSMELLHTLKEYFGHDFTEEDILNLIPSACDALNMKNER